jgi:hypothetical protein
MTFLLLLLLIGGGWAFLAALLLDRPDQIAFLPETTRLYLHIGFVCFMLIAMVRVSRAELSHAIKPWRYGPQILLRNLAILCVGVVLLIFVSRELLHGIDPSGHRAIW